MKWIILLLLAPFHWGLGLKQGDIKGVNFFGLETPLSNTDCSWHAPASFYIEELARRGFNWIRLPFSGEYVRNSNFKVMDEIFSACNKQGISISLDWHRNNNAFQDNFLENISFDEYIRTYKQVINRYYFNPTLKMVGLFNEYKGTDSQYWQQMMEKALTEIETAYPGRFFYMVGCVQWSGNCRDMDWSHLPYTERVFYDIHKYPFSGSANVADWESSFPKNKTQCVVGEWGFFREQSEWANRFVEWLNQQGIHNNFFWQATQNSGDTGGLYHNDCRDFEEDKFQIIQRLWKPDHRQMYSPLPYPNNGCWKKLNNTEPEDDWEDDEDDRRNLQGGWRQRKCSNFNDDEVRCERKRHCCYRHMDDICFRCVE